jgi:DNA-directed RNA polymerase subunit RPC12/RpoP
MLQPVLSDTTCPIHIAAEIDQIVGTAPTMPAVEVVHAKWLFDAGWVCSNCGGKMLHEVTTYGGGNYHDIEASHSLYCPHCGAKMDLEDEYDDD